MPRDANGNYTLPAGNPVVTGTVITSSWANPTMSDIAQEITNSLSRDGQGGMLAPLFFADGTVNDPSVAFTNELTLGFYREGAGRLGIAGQGKDIAIFDASIGTMILGSGGNPRVLLIPDTGGGFPQFELYDSLGFRRGILGLRESDGRVTLSRRDTDGATTLTQLILDDDGNVSVNGAAPVEPEHLTRKDYVDALSEGFQADGTLVEYVDDLDDIAKNSTYLINSTVVTNAPADWTAGVGILTSGVSESGAIIQVLYATKTGDIAIPVQYQRTFAVSWQPWVKVAEGGAFTQRLAGYDDNGQVFQYQSDLNLLLTNSAYYIVDAQITNGPVDFTQDGFIISYAISGGIHSQLLYGRGFTSAYKQWQRMYQSGAWEAWKLVVDGGAFTQRLAGLLDTGLSDDYIGDFNNINKNSTYNFAESQVTNAPVGFLANGMIQTIMSGVDSAALQILWGRVNTNSWKIWLRGEQSGIWTEWKLVVDGPAHLVGEVKIWPLNVEPDGYLRCEGQSVSRTTYAALFAVLGTAYGSVDGNTFNVPDYRGQFMRGRDQGRGLDPDAAGRTGVITGDNVGSEQDDDFEAHTHNVISNAASNFDGGPNVIPKFVDGPAVATTSTGGDETRPTNIYVNYIIRY